MSGGTGTETAPSLENSWIRYGLVGVRAALLLFLAGWMALHWYQTAIRVIDFYNPLPTWDYWRVVSDYPALKAFHFGVLWRQHNEHRILFPEIVFQLDMFVCHGRMLLPLILSSLCYAGNWAVLTYCIWSDKTLKPMTRIASALLAGGIIGWQGSAFVLARPFLLMWPVAQICILMALLLLWRVHETERVKYLIACIALATVALYSSGCGLLFWPVLIAAALTIRIRRHHLYALIFSAMVTLGCYFVDYRFTLNLDLLTVIDHPVYALASVSAYIAMPFSAIKAPIFGVCVGAINIALALALATVAIRRRLVTRVSIVLFGSYAFTLVTGALIVLGRMEPNDSQFSEAKAVRYLTTPLVNWAVLILLLIWVAARCNWRFVTRKVVLVTALILCLAGFPKLRWWLAWNTADFVREKTAAIAIENGVTDPIVLRLVFPDPGFVTLFLPMLKEEHLSVFYNGHSQGLTEIRPR
jgi:hypothetical protein